MNITIGEIIDVILPFASTITVSKRSLFPWITANIEGGSSVTRLFISVKQVSEWTYSAVVTDDVYNGNRLIPTDTVEPPFIQEKSFLSYEYNQKDIDGKNNMNVIQFRRWLFRILYTYRVIKFDPCNWSKRVVDLGFNSTKIRRCIDKTMRKMKCYKGDIFNLIESINTKHEKFSMEELEDKEIRCIYAKLKSLGLNPIIIDKNIVKIEYEKVTTH